MKQSSQWFSAALTLIAGIALLIMAGHTSLLNFVVQIIGVLIGIVGLGAFLAQSLQRKERRNPWWMVAGVAAVGIGLWLMFDPEFFVSFTVYLLAVVIILSGLWHIFSLAAFKRQIAVPIWLWIVPALLIVAGVSCLVFSIKITVSAIVLITGICLIFSAFNTFGESVNNMRNKQLPTSAKSGVAAEKK